MEDVKKPFYKLWQFWIIVGGILIGVILIVCIPMMISLAYLIGAPNGEPNTAFNASDIILFYGGVLTFGGTVTLGICSMKQNNNLAKINQETMEMQRDNYIAEHSYLGAVKTIEFHKLNNTAVNLEIHQEQLLISRKLSKESDISFLNSGSVECRITLKNIKNLPHLVKVIGATLLLGKDKALEMQISLYNYDLVNPSRYTSIGCSTETSTIKTTILFLANEKEKFVECIKKVGLNFILDIEYAIVSTDNVESILKCRCNLECSEDDKLEFKVKEEPILFFDEFKKVKINLEDIKAISSGGK